MMEDCKLSAVYEFQDESFHVSPEMIKDFNTYGYILVRNLLDKEEVKRVIKEFEDPETSKILTENKVKVSDGKGREAKLTMWGHPGNDVSGMVSRSEKVAGTCEQLLGEEVYHYHGKIVTKEPFTGGAHLWHQDYGYWYINEFLEPRMMTVFIALDKCDKSNGCLQIIEGSNRCGRLDHMLYAGQTVVKESDRLGHIMERFPKKYCLMNPGDALFFHSNLLHSSDQNTSPNRRWALLTAYNVVSNKNCKQHHHPQYQKLHKVPNSAIKMCENFDFSQKRLLIPDTIDKKQVNLGLTESA